MKILILAGYYLQDHVVLRAACQIHLHSIS